MPKGPFGFRRLTSIGPLVTDGGRRSGMITRARIRDNRFLILKRSASMASQVKGRDRVEIGFPYNIVENLGYNTSFDVVWEAEDKSEFILIPTSGGGDASYSQAGNRSSIRISGQVSEQLPFEYPRDLVLDIDMRRPEDGILVREEEGYEQFESLRPEDYLKGFK